MAKRKKKKSGKGKKARLLRWLIIGVAAALLFYSIYEKNRGGTGLSEIADLEIPAPVEGEQIVSHEGFILSYNEENEQPSWVAYVLTRDNLFGVNEREDNFRPDPAVVTGSAELADYKKSGYDRGHLVPAADMKYSPAAMDDCFFMSNMSPQKPDFNRGVWASLEAVVRTFAYDNGKIYVVTGPVLSDGPYESIGPNSVSVPKYFYKVILDYSEPELKAIGFILANEGSSEPLTAFACTVDDVEALTGLDFYPALPDEVETALESDFDVSRWNFVRFNASDAEYTPTGGTGEERRTGDVKAVLKEIISKCFQKLNK